MSQGKWNYNGLELEADFEDVDFLEKYSKVIVARICLKMVKILIELRIFVNVIRNFLMMFLVLIHHLHCLEVNKILDYMRKPLLV